MSRTTTSPAGRAGSYGRKSPSSDVLCKGMSTGLYKGLSKGLSKGLLLVTLPLALPLLATPVLGRQPGDSYRPNAVQGLPSSFQNSLQNALTSLTIPSASTLSATLAATTRFFASFSTTATTGTLLDAVPSPASSLTSYQQGALVACVAGEAGTWPVPGTNCNSFYRCGSGRRPIEYKTCSPGTVYYSEYQDCHYPSPSWRCWEPICAGRVDGLHPDWSTSCRRSVRCQGGRVTAALGCPSGQLSAGRSGCRPAHEVSCPRVSEGSAPIHLAPQRPAAALVAAAPAHPLCWGRAPSLTQDRASHCRQYFRCSASGQRSVETCPGNQVFDGARCVEPEYYSCAPGGESGNDACARLPDGLHPQPGSHCRAYFRCALGFKSVFVCSGDAVFDGERCVPHGHCAEDAAQPLASQVQTLANQVQPQGSVCAGRSHGYFADVASGCRRYVYCLSGAPVGTFTCEGGRRFDGRVCVDLDGCPGSAAPLSHGVLAPSFVPQRQFLQQPPLQPKQGFFQDLASGCRNYSFFIGGHETKLSCPTGLLFNGQLCVSEHTYACPTG